MSAHEPFVMIPVPVEHRLEFQDLVMKIIIREAALQWDLASMEGLLGALDAGQLALVDHLAERSLRLEVPTVKSVEEALGPGADITDLVLRSNESGVELGKPVLIILDDTGDPPTVGMPPPIATLVRTIRPGP